jgi:hypothetical protein
LPFIKNKLSGIFSVLLSTIDKKKIRIVDIGGTSGFWDYWENYIHKDITITLVNLSKDAINKREGIVANAENLSFIKEQKYDVLFSNSLIEHLATYNNQKKFAFTATRIAKYYFIQTPAFIFPLEPHFLFPFFHWLPKTFRIFLVKRFNLGWYNKEANNKKAKKLINEIRILKKYELKVLFPQSKIIVEYLSIFPKSYIVTNLISNNNK